MTRSHRHEHSRSGLSTRTKKPHRRGDYAHKHGLDPRSTLLDENGISAHNPMSPLRWRWPTIALFRSPCLTPTIPRRQLHYPSPESRQSITRYPARFSRRYPPPSRFHRCTYQQDEQCLENCLFVAHNPFPSKQVEFNLFDLRGPFTSKNEGSTRITTLKPMTRILFRCFPSDGTTGNGPARGA